MERRTEGWNAPDQGSSRSALTARLLELIEHVDLTVPWRDLGERAFVDTVGVLIAGAADPAVTVVAGAIDETGGPVRAVATGASMSARSAALIDGTAAHALDYDDVDDELIAHPSAVLVPALLAAGQLYGSTGEEVLAAFRVGIEAGRIIAGALDVTTHYGRGWHSTATIGAISAACALARLVRLESARARHALGIAGSLAAGSRQNFGTMTKPLHAGTAAANGLLAVRLAAGGFTSDPDLLDGPLGYLALHRAPGAPSAQRGPRAVGEVPAGLNVKLFPCCYYTHAAAEAAIEVGRKLGRLDDVTGVEVEVQSGGLAPLIHRRPVDATQAKFSMEYVVATCLIDHELTLGSFAPERVAGSAVQRLLRQVQARETESPPAGADGAFAVVTVLTGDGQRLSTRIDRPAGHASRPLTESQLRDKFDDCTRGFGQVRSARAYEMLRGLRRETSTVSVIDALTVQTQRQ